MKKRSFLGVIILTLAILLVPSYKVNADTPLEFTCNEKVADGEILECKLTYEASKTATVKSLSGSLVLSNSFTLDHIEYHELYNYSDTNPENLHFQCASNSGIPTTDALIMVYLKANVKDTKTSDQVRLKVSTIDGSMGSESNISLTSNVIKLERKNENRLATLKVNVNDGLLTPTFDSEVLEYSLVTEAEELTISATTKDPAAKVEIEGSSSDLVTLDYGNNNIIVKVTAQDGTVKKYKIIATRKDNRNDNTKLQLLSVDGKKVALKDNNSNYKVDVPYETKEANLLYATASSTSKVEVEGSEELKIGENNIIIIVTSEKGTVEKYYLTINRLKEIKSDDSSIKKLEIMNVEDSNFTFRSDNHNYTVKVPKKVNKLILNVELNDLKSKYEITGNEDLENYSKVLIKVTAEDESTTTYTILVEKAESSNLVLVLVILIIVLIGIVVAIVFVLTKKNKKDKNDGNNDSKKEGTNKEDKKEDDSRVVFTDPGDEVIKDEPIIEEPKEEKKEEVIVFTDPDEEKEEQEDTTDLEEHDKKEDTKEFVIKRPIGLDNPEFEEDKTELENPEFSEDNPNFE